MKTITIDPVEVASMLAHQAIIEELVIPLQTDGILSLYEKEEDLFEEAETVLTYKKDAQMVFDRFYDYYYKMLTNNHIDKDPIDCLVEEMHKFREKLKSFMAKSYGELETINKALN